MNDDDRATSGISLNGSKVTAVNIVAGSRNKVSARFQARSRQVAEVHGADVVVHLDALKDALARNEDGVANLVKAQRDLDAIIRQLHRDKPDHGRVSDRLNSLAAAVGVVPSLVDAIEALRTTLPWSRRSPLGISPDPGPLRATADEPNIPREGHPHVSPISGESPGAFLSYAGDDDRDRRISALRRHLAEEVGRHIGGTFPIFQDRTDIHWGQQWERRIESTLSAATFLIPVITPRFFGSAYCRHEVRRFLERERELGRDDLILPIYYIDCDQLNGADASHDWLVSVIAAHQYAEWRDLRSLPMASTRVRKQLDGMAAKVRMAMHRGATRYLP